jgi:putative FmdB family regulatory protein
MPIYEFECHDCHRKTTAIVLSRARITEVRCRRCGSANLERLVSRFATPKSEDARMEALADPASMGDIDENDPKSVARWMTRMGREMGEEFGDDLDQAMEEETAEAGEDSGTGGAAGSDDE